MRRWEDCLKISGWMSTALTGPGQGAVAGPCACSIKLSGSKIFGKFFDYLRNSLISQENYAAANKAMYDFIFVSPVMLNVCYQLGGLRPKPTNEDHVRAYTYISSAVTCIHAHTPLSGSPVLGYKVLFPSNHAKTVYHVLFC
jgi:hypothetical protein